MIGVCIVSFCAGLLIPAKAIGFLRTDAGIARDAQSPLVSVANIAPLLEVPGDDNEEPWIAMLQGGILNPRPASGMQQTRKNHESEFVDESYLHMVSAALLAVSSATLLRALLRMVLPLLAGEQLGWSTSRTGLKKTTKLNTLTGLSQKGYTIVVCAAYVVVSVGADVAIKLHASKITSAKLDYLFNPKCAVAATEWMKFMLSAFLYYLNHGVSMPVNGIVADIKWLLVPAILYALDSVLVFKAIGGIDTASVSTVIVTALARWLVFRTPLGHTRLSGIAIILTGLCLNRVSSDASTSSTFASSFLLVLVATLINATASVANEYAIKRNRALDINFQNCVMFFASSAFTCLLMLVTDPASLRPDLFFNGFTSTVIFILVVQVGEGLLVARLLFYADAMTKTVATCLRGPALVLVAAFFVNFADNFATLSCAGIVAAGCFIFLSKGSLD